MAMRIGVGEDAPFVSLTAIDNGTPGIVNIVGEKLARYPGTPGMSQHLPVPINHLADRPLVHQVGSSGSASLSFNIKPNSDCETTQTGKFGIYVPDLGESYGRSDPITAQRNTSWPHFYVGSGYVNPQMTAASQQWYGKCKLLSLSVE